MSECKACGCKDEKVCTEVAPKKISKRLFEILIQDIWVSDELKNNDFYEEICKIISRLELIESLLDLYRDLYNELGEDVLDVKIYALEQELKVIEEGAKNGSI